MAHLAIGDRDPPVAGDALTKLGHPGGVDGGVLVADLPGGGQGGNHAWVIPASQRPGELFDLPESA
jgi:hypothetical protein